MTVALPMRVRVHANEPAASLVHRLATRWSMSRNQFERFVGLRPDEVSRGEYLTKLADLSGADLVALKAATPFRRVGSRAVHLGKTWTDVADITRRALRICAGCVASDRAAARLASLPEHTAAWARCEWFVRSIATCTIHHQLLIGTCRNCDAPLGADSLGIDTCRCGSLQEEIVAPAAPNRVDQVLERMILGEGAPSEFAGAGLHQVSAHLARLGSLTLGRSEYPPALTPSHRLKLRETGLKIALSGDELLLDMLDATVRGAPPGRSGRPGLVSSYGWVWRSWLGAPISNSLDQSLRNKVRQHAELKGIRSPATPGGITLQAARSILRSGHERARRVVAGAGLLSGAELPGTPMSIERGRVQAIAAELAGLLDAKTAAGRLGIGRTQFRSLVNARLVRGHELSEQLDGCARFTSVGLDELIDRAARDLRIHARPLSGCVPLPIGCRDASVSIAAALQAIFDGRLVPVARSDGHGLGTVWVTVRDLRALVPVKDGTTTYAARELKLHYEAALWLTKEGLLGTAPGEVDPLHVERFGMAFCTSAQLGQMLGASTKAAVAACRHLGLKPAFSPPECRQTIWSKDVIGQAFRARLRRAS